MAVTPARTPSSGASPKTLLKVGDLLAGKYRVERILGEGGMGVVVAAHHQLLDQHVAVKLLYQDVADTEAQSRLVQEARSAAKLQSDHVARVVDVEIGTDGLPFIVMELLDGADLCQIADVQGALPRWLVVDYILQALEGLAHAHARGIIHRDLKPSNLFLANKADGTQIIKILDFGISKETENADRRKMQLTGGRALLGSPPYMSPEQVRAPKTVDHRTDIWSLGVCMYELLTNSMPFGGDELQQTFAQILEKEPTPIRALVTGVPEGVEQIVARCLSKNRDDRYADVGELAKALSPYGSGTWIQSADRVVATLVRGLNEDMTSGTRLKKVPSTSSDSLSIPSSPGGRKFDGSELTGTANTVQRQLSVFDGRPWLVPVISATVLAGLLIGAVGFAVNRNRQQAGHAVSEAPSETASMDPVTPPNGVSAPPATAQPKMDDTNTPPAGSVISSSLPANTSAATTPAQASSNGKKYPPSAPVVHPTPPPVPPPTAKKPPPTGKPTGLPADLPKNRD